MDAIQKVRTLKINLILDPSPPLYALIHFWGTLPPHPVFLPPLPSPKRSTFQALPQNIWIWFKAFLFE